MSIQRLLKAAFGTRASIVAGIVLSLAAGLSAAPAAHAQAILPIVSCTGNHAATWSPGVTNTTALLRAADLIQVDFHDFRPMRWYRCATSLFLHKDFRPRPRYGRLPLPLIGGKDIAAVNEWDQITE